MTQTELEGIRQLLKRRIQRRIIYDLMNARTILEIEGIRRREYIWFNEWSGLSLYYQNALRRSRNVLLVYKDLMGLEILN